MTKKVSRRRFLTCLGIGTAATGLACAGSAVGYLLLGSPKTDSPRAQTSSARPSYIKEISRPAILPRAGWNARTPNHEAENEAGFYAADNPEGWLTYEGDLRLVYRTVVIHHSALYEVDDETTIRAIQTKHMDERKWADIAYHFGVGKTGQVFEGRDLAVRGTHVEYHNTGSVGLVFFGSFDEEFPTPEQIETGQRLINWLALRLELTHLAGHRDFNDITVCPGHNLYTQLDKFAKAAGLVLGTAGYQSPQSTS